MTERLATEHLRIEYRDDPDLLALMDEYEALRARVAKLEEEVAEQSKEVTNVQWSLRRAGEREDALRARVAELEEGLSKADKTIEWLEGVIKL